MIKLYPFFYIMFSLEVKLNDHVWSWSFHKTPLRVWRHCFLSKIIVQSVLHFINVLPNHFWMEKSWKMIHDANWEDMLTKKKTCSNTIFPNDDTYIHTCYIIINRCFDHLSLFTISYFILRLVPCYICHTVLVYNVALSGFRSDD